MTLHHYSDDPAYNAARLANKAEAAARSRRERCASCDGWFLHDTGFHYPNERCPHCEALIHPDLAKGERPMPVFGDPDWNELDEERMLNMADTSTLRRCSACGHENAEHMTNPPNALHDEPWEGQCSRCGCFEFAEPIDFWDKGGLRTTKVNGKDVRFVRWPNHGAWYEYGEFGKVGSLMAPMFKNGEPDFDNVCEITEPYEDA